MDQDFREFLAEAHERHRETLGAFVERQAGELEALARAVAACLNGGGKLLAFGNGGSAAQAEELASELVNRLRRSRRALAALALGADGCVLTGIGNDTGFAEIFARQLEALGRPGDLALGISTSGASENVLRGLSTARRAGLVTAGLLGSDGGAARAHCDLPVVVPSADTARVQEVHLFAMHVLCARVEALLGLD